MQRYQTWELLGMFLAVSLVSGGETPLEKSTLEGVSWQKPGCHLLGHSRIISIPGCTQFPVVTNACRGFCPSVSLPATSPAPRPVTSLAQCCSIMESRALTVQVLCLDGERNVTLLSATSCSCYHCHKE